MAAAVSAARGRARVVVLDAEARTGGQYWRHGPAGPGPHHHDLDRWNTLSSAFADAELVGLVQHLPRHRVWRVERVQGAERVGQLVVHAVRVGEGGREEPVTFAASALVIACGAHDRVLPFPGWDLPGVLTAGGAQALLKEHSVVAGRRVVVGGTGPFLLPLAAGLAEAGAQVLAVCEAGDGRRWARGWRSVAAVPGNLAEGAQYAVALARYGVPVKPRHAVVAAQGDGRVESVTIARLDAGGAVVPGTRRRAACDAVAVGWGFAPRLELAVQAGCATGPSSSVGADGGIAVQADVEGRTSVPGVFVAGEVGGVGGAKLAVVTGSLAGRAAAAYAASAVSAAARLSSPDATLLDLRRRLGAFAATMHDAHAVPSSWTGWLDDDTVVCRCEEVTLGALHAAVDDLGASDARTAKLLTRCGMGWCQGRMCGEAVSRIVAARTGRPYEPVADGRATADRPVAVPIRLGSLLRRPDNRQVINRNRLIYRRMLVCAASHLRPARQR